MSKQWDGGKGDLQRPVNQEKWNSAWKIFCDSKGHKFRNGICIYCGELEREANKQS